MTSPDQGLSLSLAPGGGKKRDPGNEVDPLLIFHIHP